MPTTKEFIDAMVNSLDKRKLEEFATADGTELERLKHAFVAYVKSDTKMTDAQKGRIFDAFIKRVREVYLKMQKPHPVQ